MRRIFGGDVGLPPGPVDPLHTRASACGPPPSRASQSGVCRFPTQSVPPRPRPSRASPSRRSSDPHAVVAREADENCGGDDFDDAQPVATLHQGADEVDQHSEDASH